MCVSNYLHPPNPHYNFSVIGTFKSVFHFLGFICKFEYFRMIVVSYMSTENMHFMDPVQFQDQGQRPVSPVSRVENPAALSKLVPRLYLDSRPALML